MSSKHGLSRSAIACQLDDLLEFVDTLNVQIMDDALTDPTSLHLIWNLGNIQGSIESLRNSI